MTEFCELLLHHYQLLAVSNSQGIQVFACSLLSNGLFTLWSPTSMQPTQIVLSPHVLCAVDRNLYGHTTFGFSDSVSIPALTDMGYFCPTLQYL
jgi:hypothetical protein